MTEDFARVYKAIQTAIQMCDEAVKSDGISYPGFYKREDADACAELLSEETGKLFYSREFVAGNSYFYLVF